MRALRLRPLRLPRLSYTHPRLTRSILLPNDTSASPPPSSSPATPGPDTTPLETQLTTLIKSTGPLPLPTFLTQLLSNPDHGYYPTRAPTPGATAIGASGDFITSPEISQVFGELLGVWGVAEMMAQGIAGFGKSEGEGVRIVEFGAGKGTLMADFLRICGRFGAGIGGVGIVEKSPVMREAQRETICGTEGKLEEAGEGVWMGKTSEGIPVTWYSDIALLPVKQHDTPTIYLLHEFLDALPSHVFQSQAGAWHELLVTHSSMGNSRTPYATTLHPSLPKLAEKDPFHLTLSRIPTAASRLLPYTNPERYGQLLKQDGNVIEICPAALTLASALGDDISTRRKGAALMIDYGPAETIPTGSLKGIRQHRRVSPFSRPIGGVDISFDVDFAGIVEAVLKETKHAEVWGPITQASFLKGLGIEMRGKQVEARAAQEGKDVEVVSKGWRRLVEGEMGRVYKALAIVPEGRGEKGGVVGFGGDVM